MVGFTGIASAAASAYREAGTNLTWDSANAACIKEGSKLCTSAQMCSGGKPTVAAPRPSAAWAPVGDAANVWVDVGSDANACKKFEEVNGFKPEWGNEYKFFHSHTGAAELIDSSFKLEVVHCTLDRCG